MAETFLLHPLTKWSYHMQINFTSCKKKKINLIFVAALYVIKRSHRKYKDKFFKGR